MRFGLHLGWWTGTHPVSALSMVGSLCTFAAQTMVYVALPFYFQDVIGRTEVETGFLMTPWPLAVAVIAPVAGRSAGLLGGHWPRRADRRARTPRSFRPTHRAPTFYRA